MYKEKYLKYKNKYLELQKQQGGAKFCQPEDLMDIDKEKDCINMTMVTGSCADPAFDSKEGKEDISVDIKTELINLLNLIKSKSPLPKYLDIILGSTDNNKSEFTDLSNSVQLCITPIPKFSTYDEVYKNINIESNINGKIYYFNTIFPLNYKGSNSLEFLNLLIEIDKLIKVRITNKMCGTCHRSLFYLVKNNIEYIVKPEQQLSDKLDTPHIRKCFKDITYRKIPGNKWAYFKDDEDENPEIIYP